MSFFDFLVQPGAVLQRFDAPDAARDSLELANLRAEVPALRSELHNMEESLIRISDAFDNVGWSPMPEEEAREIPLKTVKKVAELSRALTAMNPFVKSGVGARIEYIWGKGVAFDGVDSITEQLKTNRRKMFTPQAYEEFERALATDGNVFIAFPTETADATKKFTHRIPLDQISNARSNPDDIEDVWYYKRTWKEQVTDANGNVKPIEREKWYISMPYYARLKEQGKSVPKRFGNIGVEQDFVMQHTAVNKQIGWRWGVPDVLPVIFWAKAYKEYLEDNATLVKAYARLAWTYKAPTAASASSAATRTLQAPSRDPMTGEFRDVGATAFSAGGEMMPVAATGSQVDFEKGSALASAIAAGLEVSKVVITRDPGSGNRATAETLDLPTLKAMETRQRLHVERFLDLFEFWGADIDTGVRTEEINEAGIAGSASTFKTGAAKTDLNKKPSSAGANDTSQPAVRFAIVTFPQIETDTTKDRVAAVVSATVDANLLFREEGRKELLDILGIAPMKPWNQVPTPEDDPYKVYEAEQAQISFDREQEAIKNQPVVPAQGKSGGVAAKGKALGTNNSARASRSKDTGNS